MPVGLRHKLCFLAVEIRTGARKEACAHDVPVVSPMLSKPRLRVYALADIGLAIFGNPKVNAGPASALPPPSGRASFSTTRIEPLNGALFGRLHHVAFSDLAVLVRRHAMGLLNMALEGLLF